MERPDSMIQDTADYADIPDIWEPSELCQGTDPLNAAAKILFNIPYLFPYQRLVMSNTLEAAETLGIPIHWPEEGRIPGSNDRIEGEDEPVEEDRKFLGQQIVILPTGAGKSLCFQLPAMLLEGITLVIYPLLSLMADQERRLRDRGFTPVILRGGQSKEERRVLWENLHSGKSRFIIANPEILLTPAVMEKLKALGIVQMVIDEAHCVSEWGDTFRPSYLEIAKIIGAVKAPLVTAFTATASTPVLEKIETYIFGSQKAGRIIGNPDRSNISYGALGCILRDLAVRDLIIKNPRPAIVFCSSRLGTEKLARYLRNELKDREIRFYHAGLSREEKTILEQWFFNQSQGILIATCAYGMGVDKADIRTVIHRDCPPSVEAYLQESGRAGRDGLPSKAILLWGPDDKRALGRARTEADRLRLSKLLAYTRNTTECRRAALLTLLNYEGTGESPEVECCDVCEGRSINRLREEAGLLQFFRQNRRCYTLTEAAQVLSQIEQYSWSEDDARKVITQLIKNNTLRQIKNFLWRDKLTLGSSRLL